MTQADVVVKGEVHSSSADLDEEIELIKQRFDVVILEGNENESSYNWSEFWYFLSSSLVFWLLNRLYMSHAQLHQIARAYGSKIEYTRQCNEDIIRNSPVWLRLVAFSLFLFFIIAGILVGVEYSQLSGMSLIFLGIALPVLVPRLYNSARQTGEKNRDQIIADKITAAASEEESVLAIVGYRHVDGIKQALPDDMDVSIKQPAYGRVSREHLREITVPVVELLLLLFGASYLLWWGFSALTGIDTGEYVLVLELIFAGLW